jgi:transcriptional regulator with XRE-family HTH domain
MNCESKEVITMTKPLSTYERKLKDKKFKEAYAKSYKELLFSELLMAMMEDDDVSVRALAKEANLSPSIIQNIRSGKQQDIKVSNLIKIAHVFGYDLLLQKGKEVLSLNDHGKGKSHHLSVTSLSL